MTFPHAVRDDQHVNDSKRMMMEDSLPRVSDFVYAQLHVDWIQDMRQTWYIIGAEQGDG